MSAEATPGVIAGTENPLNVPLDAGVTYSGPVPPEEENNPVQQG